ncbi:ABC transporter permease/substrate-binding protein [Agrilactobacillus fermenti]|uniref:ABC transporter permease/substrate-binding protein n=1 Tax=Agrilactobacillus fermenti TaxID=2586909 RepID=UPI003A5B98DB
MNNIISTLISRRSDLLQALWQHLGISLLSLLIAILIAVPLAIVVLPHKKTANIFLQLTSILQTIPSLALLGLLIPLVGIGTVPAIIALVVYALLPIFQNTYVGLTEIDPALEEAADAFGMSRLRKLFKVELPLAKPFIISGIQTAAVLIIGTATLAALIGAGGLGSFILLGIDRNNMPLIIIGAVSSAALALLISGWIFFLKNHRARWSFLSVALIILGMIGAGLYQAVKPKPETITIAGKLGSEPDILIHMYADLIKAQSPKTHVVLKSNFGKTSFLFNALRNDDIDIYPEFTGTVLESLVKTPKTKQRLTAPQTYQKARRLLQQQFQLTYLQPMAYENTYALAVKASFAKAHHLKNISDLQTVQSQLHGGLTLEFIDRDDGFKGVKRLYHLDFPVQSMEPSLRYEAIASGRVNIVDAYSTDSELQQYQLLVLKDDRHLFPPYQGAPLMRQDFAKQHPKIVNVLNKLAGRISATDMQKMNYQVNVKKQSSAKVARQYLLTHHLLKE